MTHVRTYPDLDKAVSAAEATNPSPFRAEKIHSPSEKTDRFGFRVRETERLGEIVA